MAFPVILRYSSFWVFVFINSFNSLIVDGVQTNSSILGAPPLLLVLKTVLGFKKLQSHYIVSNFLNNTFFTSI